MRVGEEKEKLKEKEDIGRKERVTSQGRHAVGPPRRQTEEITKKIRGEEKITKRLRRRVIKQR